MKKDKKVILLHGKDTDPSQKWYPWLKVALEKQGIVCIVPTLPQADDPVLDEWLEVISNLRPDENTILIGHSRGGVAVLRWLENQHKGTKVKKTILVAANNPAIAETNKKVDTHGFYERGQYDFEKIKQHCDDFVVLHSQDDEWVPFEAGAQNAKGLDAKFLQFTDRGHFGSTMKQQKIPELLEEIVVVGL